MLPSPPCCCVCNVFTFNTAQHYHRHNAHEPTSGRKDGGLHTALPSLVMGVWEINGAVNLTFFSQFPLADNFQGWPQILLKSIHRTHRALQPSENEILKLHTILEIYTSNPILKKTFFRVRKKLFANFWYFMGPYKLYNMAEGLTSCD